MKFSENMKIINQKMKYQYWHKIKTCVTLQLQRLGFTAIPQVLFIQFQKQTDSAWVQLPCFCPHIIGSRGKFVINKKSDKY